MKATVVQMPGQTAIVDIETPVIGHYQAKVKTEVATLCNATDGKLVAGNFSEVKKPPVNANVKDLIPPKGCCRYDCGLV
jgi:L-iditol 2-dehydrogenase